MEVAVIYWSLLLHHCPVEVSSTFNLACAGTACKCGVLLTFPFQHSCVLAVYDGRVGELPAQVLPVSVEPLLLPLPQWCGC